jgi:hypothetical protein
MFRNDGKEEKPVNFSSGVYTGRCPVEQAA